MRQVVAPDAASDVGLVVKFKIGLCAPVDRSSDFTFLFVAHSSSFPGVAELMLATAEEFEGYRSHDLGRNDLHLDLKTAIVRFAPSLEGSIGTVATLVFENVPFLSKLGGWTVGPFSDSTEIALHIESMDDMHKLVYTAFSDDEAGQLKYCIKVNGAISVKTNQEPRFVVCSTPAAIAGRGGATMLEVDRASFDGDNSALLCAVVSSLPSDIVLSHRNVEHQRFLVCLTYHMTHWKEIARLLSMQLENKIDSISYNQQHKLHEEAFEMIIQWITTLPNEATLNNLLHALRQNNHGIKVVSRMEENHIESLLAVAGKRLIEDKFMRDVAVKISVAWTTLGRLLGILYGDITCTLDDHRTQGAIEQAIEMLKSWCRHTAGANYAAFARALGLLLVLDPARARDAWDYTVNHLSNLTYNSLNAP